MAASVAPNLRGLAVCGWTAQGLASEFCRHR
jgi:hypothetical protein